MKSFKKIWLLLTSRQKSILLILFVAVLFNSVLEFFGIGLVVPLVSLINNPEMINNYPKLVSIMSHLGIENARNALKIMLVTFISIFVFKSIYIIKLSQLQLRFSSNVLYHVSARLFRTYLFSPWSFHVQGNSAELLNNVVNQTSALCSNFISSIFLVGTELCVVFAIMLLLLLTDPLSTIVALLFLGGTSALMLCLTHRRLENLGKISRQAYTEMVKSVNEALGGIKETKILGHEEYFVGAFMKNNCTYNRSWIHVNIISILQRSTIELIFIGGIAFICLIILSQGHKGSYLLSMLALFAVSAFRLMPSMHRINSALSAIKYNKTALDVVYNDINRLSIERSSKVSSIEKSGQVMTFNHNIELQDLSFKYPNTSKEILSHANLIIPKGKCIGFIGKSGAGKTTAVDIVLGLLTPDSGKVLADGYDIHKNLSSWRKNIGYIPQSIYLIDNTIRRNVAFGLDDGLINENKVWEALKSAQLSDFVKNLPEQLNTIVGENGVRLSGGQRQRIGIARALYHNPEILVMDEATSSLDHETEKEITNSIFKLSGEKTLIIIAHRQTTVEKCDAIYEFKRGVVLRSGIYGKSQKNSFQNPLENECGKIACEN